jgi:hypothetical protein
MPTLRETALKTKQLAAKPQGPPGFVRAPMLILRHIGDPFYRKLSFTAGKKSASEFFYVATRNISFDSRV